MFANPVCYLLFILLHLCIGGFAQVAFKEFNQTKMKERIQQLIDKKGITAGELASLLEVQRSNVSHILNGRNKPGASLIEKMLTVFPDLNARWLFTGEGNMLVATGEHGTIADTSKKINIESTGTRDLFSSGKAIIDENHKQKNKCSSEKKIDKVILLYDDGTFVSYNK